MTTSRSTIEVQTKGNNHIVNLTDQIELVLKEGTIRDGIVTIFVTGSTAAISTTEFEPGLVTRDLEAALEGIAPKDGYYLHEATWNDDNGHSHVRATLVGPGITVPLCSGAMPLGTWQQIILIDFDTRPRTREIIVQVIGE